MIALLALPALAGGPVDLSVGYPWGWTPSVTVREEQQGVWGPATVPVPPSSVDLHGAMHVDVAVREHRARDTWWVLSVGARATQASWEHQPAFEAALTEITVDYGLRQDLSSGRGDPDRAAVRAYAHGAAGVQITVFQPSYWPTHVNPMPHAQGALGLMLGHGRVRPVAELRTSLGIRLDNYKGRAEGPTEPLLWTYFPGSAVIATHVGLEFR